MQPVGGGVGPTGIDGVLGGGPLLSGGMLSDGCPLPPWLLTSIATIGTISRGHQPKWCVAGVEAATLS